jgi:energy-coupling factor transporter ATP-binding protein EcfA2
MSDTPNVDYQQIWNAQLEMQIPVTVNSNRVPGVWLTSGFRLWDAQGNAIESLFCTNVPEECRQWNKTKCLVALVPIPNPALPIRNLEVKFLKEITPEEFDEKTREHPAQVLATTIDYLTHEIERHHVELDAKQQKFNEREKDLEQKEQQFNRNQTQFKALGGPKFLELIRPEASETELAPLEKTNPPEHFFGTLKTTLLANGHDIEERILRRTVYATCTAAITGQIVIMSGPTGVGKTSLLEHLGQLFSARTHVTAVKPAWLEASDLLGFYNPQSGRYQPTPFLEHILQAKTFEAANQMLFAVLDEMNLSRIENYGADFLAKLEKAFEHTDQPVSVELYAQGLRDEATLEAYKEFSAADLATQSARTLRVQNLKRYPASIQLHRNTILFGTINHDETTTSLSPKLKDRALIVQIPAVSLDDSINVATRQHTVSFPWNFTPDVAAGIREAPLQHLEEVERIWKQITSWQKDYLQPLGIHLSHRLKKTFVAYLKVAQYLEQNPRATGRAADSFLQCKLLPWISFLSDERDKKVAMEKWAKDETLKAFPETHESVQNMLEQSPIIQYVI